MRCCGKFFLVLLFVLFYFLPVIVSVAWGQPVSITLTWENWNDIKNYTTRLENLTQKLSSESGALKDSSARLLKQLETLKEQLRESQISAAELKTLLEDIGQKLADLENSYEELKKTMISLRNENTLLKIGIIGTAVIAVVIIILTNL